MQPTEGEFVLDSAYQAQLRRGFSRLRFTPNLEHRFRADYAERHLPRLRLGFLGAAAVYAVFLIVRSRVEIGPVAAWGLALRALVIAAMLVPVAISYTRWRRHVAAFVLAAYALFAAGLTAIEVVAETYGADRRYEALVRAAFHAYAFSGLRLRPAVAAGALMLLAYFAGGLVGGLAGHDWAYQLLLITLANVLGAAALYVLEHAERESFLRRQVAGEMAGRDGLTGLPNRTAFLQHFERVLKQAAREQHPVAIAMVDLDFFRAYNDHFGHLEGDAALRHVAHAALAEFRRPLDMLARYGGEEFIGVWFDPQPGTLEYLAGQVRARVRALELPHPATPHGRLTVSVGAVGLVPGGDESMLELIRQADAALYIAKSEGRDAVIAQDASIRPAALALP